MNESPRWADPALQPAPGDRGWWLARWAGVCARCGKPFPAGTRIASEGVLGWRAKCCA